MNKFAKILFILIVIFSLSLNVVLLYDKMNTTNTPTTSQEEPVKNIELNAKTIFDRFKEYQIEHEIIKPNSVAFLDLISVTSVGEFKNSNKKLYYIKEKYGCLEGTDCVQTNTKIDIDEEYNNITTFVVSIEKNDNELYFELLDYSIEENSDFTKTKPVTIK